MNPPNLLSFVKERRQRKLQFRRPFGRRFRSLYVRRNMQQENFNSAAFQWGKTKKKGCVKASLLD